MSNEKRIVFSFAAVVAVAFLVLLAFGLIIRSTAASTSRSLCRIDHGILERQLAGARQSRTTDRFFRDNSVSTVFRTHFGALVPVQTGRIIEIKAELKILGNCK